jgi:molybdenum cofactor biosynthesis enzyme MoaA
MTYYDRIKEERKSKVNAVFIPSDDKPEKRSFCSICGRYRVWINKGYYECLNCGSEAEPKKEEGKLQDEFDSQPMIASVKGKRKHNRSDFPEGSYIKEDVEISSTDGEEKELIVDGKDV